MIDGPLITIIIGIYNCERYLSECIQSVIEQDYTNLEIILIDDGSKDNSGKIVDKYADMDSRIIVVHQKNAGVSNSRNTAIDMVRGEYVCVLDQDDIISNDYVSYFYGLCKENNAEISLTLSVDKFIFKTQDFKSPDIVQVWSGEQAVIEMLYHKIVIAPWNKMISRKLIVDNNLRFNPKYFNGEDFAFSIQAYQHAERIAVGQKSVYHYRVGNPESRESKFNEEYINSSVNAHEYIRETFINITPELFKAWKFSNWHTHCYCLNIMVGCRVTKKCPDLYKQLKSVCQKQALCALKAPISAQQKLRGILFKINPYMAAKIINHFRIRKFETNSEVGLTNKKYYSLPETLGVQTRVFEIGVAQKKYEKNYSGAENIKVSIIVPIYNVEKFLRKCLASIQNQTHGNLEIILVDDGSPDSSGKICDEIAAIDKRVKVIHKQNEGVSKARNSGIDAATGEYLCFIDGDDFVMTNYVEYMLNLAIENDAEIALTTQMFGNFDESQVEKEHVRAWTGEEAVEAILCYRVPIGCYCKLFKREFLDDVRFIPEIFIGEGFNFNITAFQKAEKVMVGQYKTYYYRRDNPTSAMTKFSIKKCECGLWALEVIRENLSFHSSRIEKAWEYANWRTHSDFYDMIVLADAQKEYPVMYRRCLDVTKKRALTALKVPTSKKNKLRALIMRICPQLVPLAMKVRNKRYQVNVSNR